MQQTAISALVAAVVAAAVVLVFELRQDDESEAAGVDALAEQLARHPVVVEKFTPPSLSYTMELVEDGWVDASRTAGADNKPLADAASSICFLTKIEIKGIRGPGDSNSCRIDVDEFTGFWEVTAAVEEGGASEVRCNARCLVWE